VAELSVIILTYNEESHIERAIRSAQQIAAHIFVVDSFSTDRTCDIARALGAEIVQHAYIVQSQQFQWALDTLPIATEWVMRLDADETLTPQLVWEINQSLPRLPTDVTGVNLRRRHIFMGRWIRYGARYPIIQLRIWRRGAARIELRWMDEHMVLQRGRSVGFKHDFTDHNLGDLTSFIRKHNRYATREAIDVLIQKYRLLERDRRPATFTNAQWSAKRRVKEKFYNRLPASIGPGLYFCYRYFLLLGFLDGQEGLIYHFLQAFWYRFLVTVKVKELERSLKSLPNRAGRAAELERMTGYSPIDLKTTLIKNE
jgi:glycosyltransferase involved in cell wall biosynthesis